MALTKPPVLPPWAETAPDNTQPTNPELQAGWPLSALPPTRQRFNWILNFLANGVRYLTRRGIADWASTEPYEVGDYARGGDGNTYRAIADHTNQAPPNATYWELWGLRQVDVRAESHNPISLAPNPFFEVDQLANAATSVADDTYGHDHWYALTQTASIQISSQTLQENGQASNARLTQNQAAAQRMGYACIISSAQSQKRRGEVMTYRPRFRCSVAQAIRIAVLEWTGTADAVVSDVVNDWTSSDYTDGAAKFFVNANFTPLGTVALTPSANVWTDMTPLTVTIGNSCNNIVLFIWTEGTAAQTVTLDPGIQRFVSGTYSGKIHIPTFHETLRYANRFFDKSFNYGTAPAQNIGLTNGEQRWHANIAGAVSNFSPTIMLTEPMIVPPTITLYNPAAANAQVRNITDSTDHSASSAINISERGFVITSTGLAGTALGEQLGAHWTAYARL